MEEDEYGDEINSQSDEESQPNDDGEEEGEAEQEDKSKNEDPSFVIEDDKPEEESDLLE